MSGFDGKTPGRSSGVTAGDLVSGDVSTLVPGRTNLVQTYDIGSRYVDDGPKCDGKDDNTPGCFLTDKKRTRLLEETRGFIGVAQTNYKLALLELQLTKLIEKEDDLPWFISLALDLATAHFASAASKALNRIKASTVAEADQAMLDAARRKGVDDAFDAKTADSLRNVSDKAVESMVKTGFDLAKKQAVGGIKTIDHDADRTEKAATLSVIEQLKVSCDVAFQTFTQTALAEANDAQLVVLHDGMDARYHSEPLYRAALTEKFARYNKAGIGDVGRKAIAPSQAHTVTTYTNKRCVWLKEPGGNRSLWFYSNISGDVADPWENGRDVSVEKVPDEFVDAALSKSEQKWGPTPTVDHPGAMIVRRLHLRDIPAPTGTAGSKP